MAVGERLFRDVYESGANVVACDSETCRWQIEHGTDVHAVHPVELLYRAYGLDAPVAVSAG
jgi:glycerol-3-phosphate dehydrogenase subunit C